jgi:hypothetical protein
MRIVYTSRSLQDYGIRFETRSREFVSVASIIVLSKHAKRKRKVRSTSMALGLKGPAVTGARPEST